MLNTFGHHFLHFTRYRNSHFHYTNCSQPNSYNAIHQVPISDSKIKIGFLNQLDVFFLNSKLLNKDIACYYLGMIPRTKNYCTCASPLHVRDKPFVNKSLSYLEFVIFKLLLLFNNKFKTLIIVNYDNQSLILSW